MTKQGFAGTVRTLTATAALATIAVAGSASATTVTLDFNSLPSDQGWTYRGEAGVAEGDIFSVGGGVLSQDTIGQNAGYYFYFLGAAIDPLLPYSLAFTARVIAQGGDLSRDLGAFGFYVTAGGLQNAVILQPGIIQDVSETVLSTSIDTTVFHRYRMDVAPGGGYQLFVDDVLLASGPAVGNQPEDGLNIGDWTFVVSAQGELTDYVFRQAAPIPLPAALPLFGAALAGLAAAAARQRRPGA